jgi:aldose 1-epimerase
MKIPAFALLLPLMTQAANYSAHKAQVDGVEVVQLTDAGRRTEVSIVPSVGNMAYEIKVGGKNILWFPYHSPAELKAKHQFCGIPFLAPWANRLDDDAYWANGKKYQLNTGLGNIGHDGHQHPIHGLLNYWPNWEVISVASDDRSAWVSSRFDFGKYPDLMAQFPFAHTITMTYRLANGEVEVETVIDNRSTEPMPVAIGFHPYFHLDDAPRDQWKVHLAARDHMILSDQLIPTGAHKAVEFADPHPLAGSQLDDVFGNLVRGGDGTAQFWVEGARQRITVAYGPKYTTAVVYAPRGKDFVCFEPMAAITNAFNLAHSGIYRELQSIEPGGRWKESYVIKASGF